MMVAVDDDGEKTPSLKYRLGLFKTNKDTAFLYCVRCPWFLFGRKGNTVTVARFSRNFRNLRNYTVSLEDLKRVRNLYWVSKYPRKFKDMNK